jgi:putative addiction module CopG family antidote
MEVHLTPDQESFVRAAIESGRLQRAEEAVEQALLLWEERERSRIEILAALDAAEADLQAGRFITYTDESLPELVEEIKHEAKASRQARLSA